MFNHKNVNSAELVTGKQPQVLFLCAGSGIGGMERVVRNLSCEFNKRSIGTHVVLPETDGAEETKNWFAAAGISVTISPALMHSFGKRRIRSIPALASLIRRSQASVVNVHYGMNFASLNDIIAVRLAGLPCVASMHAGGGNDPMPSATRRKKNEWAAHLCTRVIAVSEFQAGEFLRHGTAKEKIMVIPCGIPSLSADTRHKQAARRRFGIPENAFVILAAARLDKRKGIGELIEAVAAMSPSCDSVRRFGKPFLLVAGIGPAMADFKSQAERLLPSAHYFAGFVSDMASLYTAGDLFVLPSHEESFGLVYAEAALHGLPIVGGAVGGVPGTIGDSRTGLMIPPRDVLQLTSILNMLHLNIERRTTMGMLAHVRARKEFSVTTMADGYLKALFPQEGKPSS